MGTVYPFCIPDQAATEAYAEGAEGRPMLPRHDRPPAVIGQAAP
jgi:hypothetical protein